MVLVIMVIIIDFGGLSLTAVLQEGESSVLLQRITDESKSEACHKSGFSMIFFLIHKTAKADNVITITIIIIGFHPLGNQGR